VQYAGGGGSGTGAGGAQPNYGLGTAGGGTASGTSGVSGTSALANTGSGGGGSPGNTSIAGGSGGSGIVVIRYPAALNTPTSVVNAQISYAYGYQIYTWTQSGSITF
jgi:hypothetical protein